MKSPVVKAVKKTAEKVAEAVKEIAQSVKPLRKDPFYSDDARKAAVNRRTPRGMPRHPANRAVLDLIDQEQAERRGGGWIPRRRNWLG